jgi:hypothetical protein
MLATRGLLLYHLVGCLLTNSVNQHYYYHCGINVQAVGAPQDLMCGSHALTEFQVIAYLVGIALPFAGFCGTLGMYVELTCPEETLTGCPSI